MSDGKVSFTPEQEAAIKHRGGALLVSAAAGSGKTKVLVERLLDRVKDGDNIDEFLVITYTRAAASELRERILDEILERLADAPENRNLRRQSLLCRGASIDTIHGFCTDILRENAHLASLPPDFRVTDESESDIIKAEVLGDVLDKAYETIETSSDFRTLIDMMSGGRDDSRITRIIIDAHTKLQSNPDPRSWASEQILRLTMSGISDVSETVWGAQLIGKARRTARFWSGEMARVRMEMRDFPQFDAAYGTSVETSISDIEAFMTALDDGWDEAVRRRTIDFPRPKSISGYEQLKDIRKRCKAAMDKCAAVFECGSEDHIEDMRAIAPAMTALLRLVLDFDRAYSEEKRRRGAVDFSDLEHLALSLLIDAETGSKTGLARAISRRFKEIMVDEYQDVNAVQEYIFNAVSQDGGNIFMVGDVKQSIYRFRLADPSIFLAKYRSFKDAGDIGDNQDNLKILLSKNFRSRAGVLDAVNFVFANIMSVEFGEMDYTERERLVPGREDDGDTEPAAEFDIIDMNGSERDEDEESPAREQIEARHIAQRIIELTGGEYMIPDGRGGKRRIEYSDIVILLRSIRDKAWKYASALAEYDIPVDMPGGEGFFETVEISVALSLLSVIDNPMQDIPLASALRGPVYGFTADELAEIRAESPGTDFYGALVKAAESNIKCAAFIEEIDEMRAIMPDMPADRFIWHMYNKTGLLGRVGAMRGGDRRRNNLILLVEYARMFEQNGYKGSFGFLTYIRSLQERGAELTGEAAEPASNCVRIMSIHKSKGLEFPVVILADTSKRLNNKDAQQPLVIHHDLGVGAMLTDRQRRIEYPTLARLAVQSKLTSEMMAEELRVLYVAMTRAREKLIVTAAFPNASNFIEKLSGLSSGSISPQALEEIKCTAGWILLPVMGRSGELRVERGEFGVESGEWRAESGGLRVESGEGGSVILGEAKDRNSRTSSLRFLDLRIYTQRPQEFELFGSILNFPFSIHQLARVNAAPGIPPAQGAGESDHKHSKASPDDVETLRERFGFVYPYARAPELPSKLTVTGLKGRGLDYEAAEEAVVRESGHITTVKKGNLIVERGKWKEESGGLSAAERGTALHLAMQYIDFNKCGVVDGVEEELERLTIKGLLSEEQRAAVEAQKITRFFESVIGKRVLNAEEIKREFKFSLLYPAEYFYQGGGDDEILFQGVVDCYFEEGGELVVVDFKTDRVTPETIEEKANSYAPQLTAYSDALARITGKQVKERVVYFFALDKAVLIK